MPRLTISDICHLYHQQGHTLYGGEQISQLHHALQCAALAEASHQPPEMIVACLLHDIGHLLHDLGDDVSDRGIDDCHEYRAIPYLQTLFSPAVTEPIRLHVQAKRYLCALDPTYGQGLSDASKHSLELQGGILSPEATHQFIHQPYAQDAIQLRRWDDEAKIVGLATPDLEHFASQMYAIARS